MSSVSKPRVRHNRHKQGLNLTLEKLSADFRTNIKRDAFTSCKNLRTLRLSPFIKASDDPWEPNNISYDFIYEYWPQIENIVFDETLKNTKYAFGLRA